MKILAADLGGTNTKMGITDELGNVEQFREYPTESDKGGPHVILRLLSMIYEYDDTQYDAIAISTAGQVNAEEGFIVYANENIPFYTGMRVRDMVSETFNKPVRIENDVNAAALGEAHFGAAQNFNDFLCLTFGTGVGGSIIINRQIYKGASGVAAEFGHMFTHPLSHIENEGIRSSFYETFASTTALVKNAQKIDGTCTNGKILFDAIHQGHEELQQVLHDWIDEVSVGLASLIHIFNPAAIIVGGGVMEQDTLVHRVEERTKSLVMESFRNVRIVKASLGNQAGLLGAASLFLR
ncbi:putative NBD/HSP70 family sugar kinase [Paenibacillus shirakamiensis]|uniref:NBD/HSP70 family sugar kinase n=1 Tax=Paenibacillus shirakamiensis TaxID=1265935 RepID=A0ABS4JME8_9BACL|nr:ROK family protein [Paenibacillus shirakamiensis]MBP2002166.1 putative NBD/HSP70 family sugar kinase [Paenibacillus shirakamiensis]